ncbi:ankyrin [Rhizodiscina lignyota]|uniref:Ankyrin n=1 Tax=Rhizodiscina lignyota TaxID=1504668 RepID=A0A9P4MD33_9PEZI|nr:ankyrin [Rhizodiscina lignyota]
MADEGATPRELLLESCRRNNTDLLSDLLHHSKDHFSLSPSQLTDVLNHSTDGIGAHALHVAAACGAYEVLDLLLDQEGLEVDPLDRMEGDTPLHKAVRWVNGLDKGEKEELGEERVRGVVEILVDAGCDPRIRNKAKLKPFDLVDPRNTELRSFLQKAEYSFLMSDDVVQEDDDDGPTGSGSDSD